MGTEGAVRPTDAYMKNVSYGWHTSCKDTVCMADVLHRVNAVGDPAYKARLLWPALCNWPLEVDETSLRGPPRRSCDAGHLLYK